MSATPVGLSPTQTREPCRTTARTIVQTALGILLAVGVVVPAAVAIVGEEWAAWLPADAAAVLGTVAAVAVAVSGTVARIMAIPAVNSWLDRVGLSAGRTDLYEPVWDRTEDGTLPAAEGSRYIDADGDGRPDVAR